MNQPLRDPNHLVTEEGVFCAPLIEEHQMRMLTVEKMLEPFGLELEPGKTYRVTVEELDI